MDHLQQSLQSTSITESNVYREHPRWGDYKNEGKLKESQRHRRQTHLQRQKKAQEERLDAIRKLCDEADEGDYQEPRDDASSRTSVQRGQAAHESHALMASTAPVRHMEYVGYLMLGEWLIDVPEKFAEKWKMIPCPYGRRCLVVAKQGTTRAYAKNGRILTSFESALPGGSYSIRGSLTMLDCIYMRGSGTVARDRGDRFFVLDVLCWNKYPYMDTNYDVRQFIIQSKIEECSNDRLPFPFFTEPSCPCTKEEMTEMLEKDFDFTLDGLLFYYRDGSYTPDETPLVGWLKPWMLTDVLGVDVPEIYTKMKPPTDEPSMESEKYPQSNPVDGESRSADEGGAVTVNAEKMEGADARSGTC